MASSKMYFADDLLNFTVKDLHEHIRLKDPDNVTEEHLEKLRDLMRQRDEMAQSDAGYVNDPEHTVDANKLEEILRQISSRPTLRSSPPRTPTPDPNGPMVIQRQLREEREAYDALVQDGCQPSHPVDLGFDVLDSPGEYKDIISYWRSLPGTGRLLFLTQLHYWRKFREYQQKVRQYYIPRNRFSDYQQKVRERRRRHGLEGDVELHQDRDRQSRLGNWMEYQDYNYQGFEQLEKEIEEAQGKLDSAQKKLREAGVPGFKGAYEPDNFGNNFSLCLENDREIWEAWKEMELAEKGVELAEKRLKAAESDDSRDMAERAALTKQAQEEVKSAQKRLDESRKLNEKAKLGGKVLGALNGLAYARRMLGQHKILLEWTDRRLRVIASECATSAQDTENHGQVKKARSRALRNHFASEASRPNGSSKGSGHKGKPPTARSILSPVVPSRVSKAAGKKSAPPRQKRSVPCDASQSAEKATINPSNPQRSSKRISKLKDNIPARGLKSTSLRPIHSSRVSKARRKASGGAQSNELHVYDTKLPPTPDRRRNKQERRLGKSPAPSAGLRPTQLPTPANTPPRRSTRISKKPERFCAS